MSTDMSEFEGEFHEVDFEIELKKSSEVAQIAADQVTTLRHETRAWDNVINKDDLDIKDLRPVLPRSKKKLRQSGIVRLPMNVVVLLSSNKLAIRIRSLNRRL